MKKLITITLVLVCSACTVPTKINKAKAEFLCKDSGGLYSIHTQREYPVKCKDGTVFNKQELKSTIITDTEYLPE